MWINRKQWGWEKRVWFSFSLLIAASSHPAAAPLLPCRPSWISPPKRYQVFLIGEGDEFDWKKMESIVKKYQQKFRKIKDEMSRWEELQSRLISQFSNASSIIQRLQVFLFLPLSLSLSAYIFFEKLIFLLSFFFETVFW